MPTPPCDAIEWICANLTPSQTDSTRALYDHMESQSGACLPVIYQPFDGRQRSHFVDRGAILDFALAAPGERVLDFGPGDGWPSLDLALLGRQVTGVDGSRRRVEVCRANASRLGITNAAFVHVPPGQPLPFDDESFDAVVAASSIEQTPDPRATLAEIHRVLAPGGRLRMYYESLDRYRGGRERELSFGPRTVLYDRHLDEEYVRHYLLTFDAEKKCFEEARTELGPRPAYADLTPAILSQLQEALVSAETWTTRHPSGRTFAAWLGEIGFAGVAGTHDGNAFAGALFDRLAEADRPGSIEAVDTMLRPQVEVVAPWRRRWL